MVQAEVVQAVIAATVAMAQTHQLQTLLMAQVAQVAVVEQIRFKLHLFVAAALKFMDKVRLDWVKA
jgi:hypothetical protein